MEETAGGYFTSSAKIARGVIKPELRELKWSARIPRASSGVAPELSTHHLIICRRQKMGGTISARRENHTPEACAPKSSPMRPVPPSEFGLKLFRPAFSFEWPVIKITLPLMLLRLIAPNIALKTIQVCLQRRGIRCRPK